MENFNENAAPKPDCLHPVGSAPSSFAMRVAEKLHPQYSIEWWMTVASQSLQYQNLFCQACDERERIARIIDDEIKGILPDAELARTETKQDAVSEPRYEGLSFSALFGVAAWNPLEAGINGVPLMVPAHEYNRVASSLAEALSLAIQYVPFDGYDAEEIRRLERAATIPPNDQAQAPGAEPK